MPTPSSGPITFSDIAWIVYRSYTAQISLNDTNVRYLVGFTTPQSEINMNNARSKPGAGSADYITPGSYTFLCPAYENISIDVRGAGGGGGQGGFCLWPYGSGGGGPGSAGANSSFAGIIIAIGGGAGGGGGGCFGSTGYTGSSGNGLGGSVTVGGGSSGGSGGGPNGGGAASGGSGGPGGKTTKSYIFMNTSGYPVWGSNYTVVVGNRGAGAPENPGINPAGYPGSNGAVYISWS